MTKKTYDEVMRTVCQLARAKSEGTDLREVRKDEAHAVRRTMLKKLERRQNWRFRVCCVCGGQGEKAHGPLEMDVVSGAFRHRGC